MKKWHNELVKKLAAFLSLLVVGIVFCFISPSECLAANAPDKNSSSLSATTSGSNQAPADGVTQAKMTVVLKDAYGNYLSGETVSITFASSYTLSVTPSTATLNSSGTAEFTFTSTKVGKYTLDIYDNSQGVTLGNMGEVTFFSPTCNDTAPGSAPKLISAAAISTSQITLKWEEAADPVTYYLVSYGTSPGNYIYGNPNVGGDGTTSYTVGSLAAGKKYYFAVRAGNGCTPGAFSSELSATALTTNTISKVTASTVATIKPEKTVTTKAVSATPTPEVVSTQTPVPVIKTSFFSSRLAKTAIPLIVGGVILVIVGSFIYLKTRKRG